MTTIDPATDPRISAALYATLRTRWKTWQDAIRNGSQSLIDTTYAALVITLDQCSVAVEESAEPRPTITFTLEYPDAP